MRNLLEHIKVVYEDHPDRMERYYYARLEVGVNQSLDRLAMRRHPEYSVDLMRELGQVMAYTFYDLFYGEVTTLLHELRNLVCYACRDVRDPIEHQQIFSKFEELFTALSPSQEALDSMIRGVTQAQAERRFQSNSARRFQSDSALEMAARQQEYNRRAVEQQRAVETLLTGGRQRGGESLTGSVLYSQMWEALLQRTGASRAAQRPEHPPENAPPGYLHEEEDIGDNVLEDGIEEAKKFVAEFLRDVGSSDTPDPE